MVHSLSSDTVDVADKKQRAGIQLVMYSSCASILFRQRKRRKNSLYLLAYITLLLVTQTVYCAVTAKTVQAMYIDNRDYPGGPWQYFLSSKEQATNVVCSAALFVATFLSDLLVVCTSSFIDVLFVELLIIVCDSYGDAG